MQHSFKTRSLLYASGICTVLSLIIGCSSPPVRDEVADVSTDRIGSATAMPAYRIQPGDQMDIKFYNVPELNETVTVRPDGRLSLELAHEITAAGLTTEELGQAIVKQYAVELNQPKVTVILKSFAGQKVFVQGEVNKPDLMVLSPNMTLLQSIAIAGGMKDTARTEEIILIRRGKDGKREIAKVDVSRVLSGSDPRGDLLLAPYDIVYVPKTTVARLNVWVDKYLRQNIPISFSLAYGINY